MDRNKITEVEKKIKQIDLKEKIQTTILEIQMPSSPIYLFTIFAAENSRQKIRLPISYCLFLPSKFPDFPFVEDLKKLRRFFVIDSPSKCEAE